MCDVECGPSYHLLQVCIWHVIIFFLSRCYAIATQMRKQLCRRYVKCKNCVTLTWNSQVQLKVCGTHVSEWCGDNVWSNERKSRWTLRKSNGSAIMQREPPPPMTFSSPGCILLLGGERRGHHWGEGGGRDIMERREHFLTTSKRSSPRHFTFFGLGCEEVTGKNLLPKNSSK